MNTIKFVFLSVIVSFQMFLCFYKHERERMKTFYLFVFSLFVCTLSCAETVMVGEKLADEIAKDHMVYIDGNFISWYDADCDADSGDMYEVRQHFIWTDEEIKDILKEANLTNDEIRSFFIGYNVNLDERNNGGCKSCNSIKGPASVMELYNTCVGMQINSEKCSDFYLKAYEASVKKFNGQKYLSTGEYTRYGPLNLPITTLIFEFFIRNKDSACRVGRGVPSTNVLLDDLREVDHIAFCSYSEETEKYKCVSNTFYNDRFRCNVAMEGFFYRQGNDLMVEYEFSNASVRDTERPYNTLNDMLTDKFGWQDFIKHEQDWKNEEQVNKSSLIQRDYF